MKPNAKPFQPATTISENKSTSDVQSEIEHGHAKTQTMKWSNCGIKAHLNH